MQKSILENIFSAFTLQYDCVKLFPERCVVVVQPYRKKLLLESKFRCFTIDIIP